MTGNIKSAFDSIRAEQDLKAGTLSYITGQVHKRRAGLFPVRRLAAALACLIIVMAGVFTYNAYFTETAYVDLDVNPSIELAINRFDRVIGIHAYNAAGEDVLAGLDLMHKNYRAAVEAVIGAMAQKGYIDGGGLVSVTLQTDNKQRESAMLTDIESAVLRRHGTAYVNAFPVDGETRTAAHDANLSPAKYLAILELQKVDPDVTVDSCRDHTIGEINKMTAEHSASHNDGADDTGTAPDDTPGTGHQYEHEYGHGGGQSGGQASGQSGEHEYGHGGGGHGGRHG